MGVDHLDNLWAWHAPSGTMTLLSRDGAETVSHSVAGAAAVQADAEWGIVSLSHDGGELRVQGWSGGLPTRIALPARAFDACWLGPSTVAVTPKLTADRVEVWDVRTGTRTTTMGKEVAIERRPGVTRPRDVFLRRSAASGDLYTLDSYSGEVVVFDVAGKAILRAGRSHPEQAQMDAHIARLDERIRGEGHKELLSFLLWNGFALRGDEVWLLESCDSTNHVARLVRISAKGMTQVDVPLDQPCCSNDTVAAWGRWLIFYDEQLPQREGCGNAIRRIDQ